MAQAENPEQDLVKAAEELDIGIREELEAEQEIDQDLQTDIQRIRNQLLPEIRDIIQEEQTEGQQMQEIGQDVNQVKGALADLGTKIKKGRSNEKIEEKFEQQVQGELNEIVNDLGMVIKEFQQEKTEVGDEIKTLVKDLNELEAAYEAIQGIRSNVALAAEIEANLELMSQEHGYGRVQDLLRKTGGDERSAQQWLQQIQEDERELEALLEEIDQMVQKEASLDLKEVEGLKEEIKTDATIISELNQLEQLINREHGGEPTGPAKKILSNMEKLKQEAQAVEQQLERLEGMKEAETPELQQVGEKASEMLSMFRG
ncbi:MAG: hypothetical protein SVS85_03975 [Candidatus Nanohaloarchaea archaeon]|nr:hypothetical protein [Candidatus Nanohaloarchaea archaeon]